ncbi:peptidylprolyl isomerase [Vibrio sp. WXL103]|uniref:peptidylprolyl isomerase n=1 Tax=Vibrio sp. WXL103 TaxID=3450710 RepID=UPI003EC87E38
MNTNQDLSKVAHHYQCLKLAQEKFALNLSELESNEQQYINNLAEQTLNLQRKICNSAEARVVHVDDEQIKQAMTEIVEQCGDIYQYHMMLEKHHIDEASLRDILRQELLCNAVLDMVSTNIPELAQQDAYEYYFRHQDKFSRKRCWDVSQILLTINEDFAENTLAAAEERIKQLYSELTLDNFSNMALRHSECPSAVEGGHLGWCEEGKLYPQLESALQWLPNRVISAPIQTELGFHILIRHDEKPPQSASFDEALPSIRALHNKRAKQYLQREWIKGL